MSELAIRPFAPGDGAIVASWRYAPPYDVCNADCTVTDDPRAATSTAGHYAVFEGDELVGTVTFGADARVPDGVPDGVYEVGPLDVGLHMRPDLTGQGRGARWLDAVLAFAARELGATTFRATIAAFNERALRLCERAGFRRTARFAGRDRAYWILVRG